ncbi:formyl transferase [Campylobacter hyointestinalis]|uniref:phosphoribosylglycinamide formyltransferase 1 n=1 Tax=Campylobacter hyointestinalis TaxID=198 RepID=A0A562XM43_CAMHY|nr:formyltransferase family protein [Campylobacter hyointestinalis]TWO23178.1 formyl transferase [Campylobacter hyointestinalis]
MRFKNVFVVGKGRVALECAKIARTKFKNVELLNLDNIQDKDMFFNKLKNAFIISANNFYIFKKVCVENNYIINYHNSLLPSHRGVNAHIWSIWSGDTMSGISWHEVQSTIDTGRVLIQKEIAIKDMSANELLLAQHKAAIFAFDELLNSGFETKVAYTSAAGGGELHKRYELPNAGVLEVSWEFKKLVRFLKAFDVGVFREIPYPKVSVLGDFMDILYYEIGDGFINLSLENGRKLNIIKEQK